MICSVVSPNVAVYTRYNPFFRSSHVPSASFRPITACIFAPSKSQSSYCSSELSSVTLYSLITAAPISNFPDAEVASLILYSLRSIIGIGISFLFFRVIVSFILNSLFPLNALRNAMLVLIILSPLYHIYRNSPVVIIPISQITVMFFGQRSPVSFDRKINP